MGIERRKATRALKKSRTRLTGLKDGEDALDEARTECHEREVDLNYTLYFPLAEKYWSLYPKTNGGDGEVGEGDRGKRELGDNMDLGGDDGQVEANRSLENPSVEESQSTKDPPQNVAPSARKSDMWYRIERAMEEGTLEAMRNWRPNKRLHKAKRLEETGALTRRTASQKVEKTAKPAGKRIANGSEIQTVMDDTGADGEGSDGGFFEE